jgi:hypothetical protein
MSEEFEIEAKKFIKRNMKEDLQIVIKKGTILYHGSLHENFVRSLEGGMLFFGLEPSISLWYILELREQKEDEYQAEITAGYMYEFIVNTDIVVTYLPKIEDQCTSSNMLHLQEAYKGDPFRLTDEEYEKKPPILSFELTFPVDKINTEISFLNRCIINIDCIRKEYNTEDVYKIYDLMRELNTHVKKDRDNIDKPEEDTDVSVYDFQPTMISLKEKDDQKEEMEETEESDIYASIRRQIIMKEDINPFNKLIRDFVISINQRRQQKFGF